MNDTKTFKGVVDNKLIEFEILYTFNSTKTKKDYIIYTDHTRDENDNLNIYSSIYYPFESDRELEPVESNEDFMEVEQFLNKMGEQ